jgi:Ca2+:H+ antiporter
MSSVHHAEIIAHKIGDGLGTLVLALWVTIIEVGLIISLMTQAGSDANVLARDTVFSVVMTITSGMVAPALRCCTTCCRGFQSRRFNAGSCVRYA